MRPVGTTDKDCALNHTVILTCTKATNTVDRGGWEIAYHLFLNRK